MSVYLRNKASGEIREVEGDSPEFRDLQKQVTAQGLPLWEQTGAHQAEAVKERAKFGELREEDLGTDAQEELRHAALKLASEGVSPEQNPHLSLSPGEVEAGLTREQKLADLESQYAEGAEARKATLDEAATAIADEREERPVVESAGQSARAGGSDVREGAPLSAEGGE